jgi:hypothetical protein
LRLTNTRQTISVSYGSAGYLLLLTFQDATNLFYGDELLGLEPSADLQTGNEVLDISLPNAIVSVERVLGCRIGKLLDG